MTVGKAENFIISELNIKEGKKSYQLKSCHVFLPPQEFLHLRSHGRQQIICVHQNMDETVDTGTLIC